MRLIPPLLLLSSALALIGFGISREEFGWNLGAFMVAFGAYLWLAKEAAKLPLNFIMGLVLAIGLRLVLFLSWPSLSDDYYRFFFDGTLLVNGINPYLYLPEEVFLETDLILNEYSTVLLNNMNSAAYFSVYPPLHQVFFWIATLAGENLFANIISLRIELILFDGLNIYLLYKLLKIWKLPLSRVWLYAFNPLVVLELSGNLHFEGMVLTGLLASLYFYQKMKPGNTAWAWAFAIGVKLNPLMLAPSWLSGWRKGKVILFIFVASGVTILFLLPIFYTGSAANFSKSIRLYQSTFEFNASVYYLIRWIWMAIVGYNPIATLGPLLNLIAIIGILWIGLWSKITHPQAMANRWVWIYFLFLCLQTTVHPWYLIPAFGISILTKERIFLVWTGLVFLSYSAYSNVDFKESYFWVTVEYLLLFLFFFYSMQKNHPGFSSRLSRMTIRL